MPRVHEMTLFALAVASVGCVLDLPTPSTEPCLARDALTRALFRFEESGGVEVQDDTDRHPGTIVGKQGTQWSREAGPKGCGQALRLVPDPTTPPYAEIPHHQDWDLERGSIALWVRFDRKLPDEAEGILSRDANLQERPGHFLMFRACDGRIVVRLQRPMGDYYVCSDPVTGFSWHHIGVNFGGGPLQLYIDGRRAQNTAPVDCKTPPGTPPCGTGQNTGEGIDGNENPWVIGAITWSSDEGPNIKASHGLSGAVDHLQIRSERWEFGE